MDLPILDQWLVRRMGWMNKEGLSSLPAPEDVRRWQLERLREVVARAQKNSPFYGGHFSGVDTASILSVDDFSHLPMMTPGDVSGGPEQLLCVSQDEIARVVTLQSSGTTGPPKRIFHTEDDLEATRDYFAWGIRNLVGPGETAFVLMPGDRPGGVGTLLVDALSRSGARAVPHGVMENSAAALDHCLSEEASCIVGPASHVNMLACAWEKRELPKDQIRSVLLCWDVTPDAVMRNVERAFGCRVFRHWGMIETGLGGAVECAPGSGLHLRETDVYIEIVSPQTGDLLPDGEFGELVVTTPLRRGMPLIRYRTGDAGRLLPGQCACGSPLRRLDPLVYRMADGVEMGSGKLTLRALNETLYGVPGLEDFSVRYASGYLSLRVCADAEGLAARARDALLRLAVIEEAVASFGLVIDVQVSTDGSPAVPGLGKRCIQT